MARKNAVLVTEDICPECVQSKGRPHRRGCTAAKAGRGNKDNRSATTELLEEFEVVDICGEQVLDLSKRWPTADDFCT